MVEEKELYIKKYLFFMLPLFPEKGNIIEENMRRSFFTNWAIAFFLCSLIPFGFYQPEGKLLALFFLLSFFFYTCQYMPQKKFQEWLDEYKKAEYTTLFEPVIMKSRFSFVQSLLMVALSCHALSFDQNMPVLEVVIRAIVSGYCLAVFSSGLLISLYIKKTMLDDNAIPIFWVIISGVSIYEYLK